MRAVTIVAGLLLAAIACRTSHAFPVASVDELCDPGDDPCVIDQPIEVSAGSPLDFGLRKVLVIGAGSFSGGLALYSGAFEASVDGRLFEVTERLHDSEVKIVARRSCSLAAIPCLRDTECIQGGVGLCSAGDGSLMIRGEILGIGSTVEIHASADAYIGGDIRVSGYAPLSSPTEDGGSIRIESTHGSIVVDGVLAANHGYDEEREPGWAGNVILAAADDISLRRRLLAKGGLGYIQFQAGGSVDISAPILANGVANSGSGGTFLEIDAGDSISFGPRAGSRKLRIRMYGGQYSGFHSTEAGTGGSANLSAGGDISIAEGVTINANSGRSRGDTDDLPWGGIWQINSGGSIAIDGRLSARGRGRHGRGREITLRAHAIRIGPSAVLTMASNGVDTMTLEAFRNGPVQIDGVINVRGGTYNYDGDLYGYGGNLFVTGGDVAMSGIATTGGGDAGGDISFDVCRLHLESTSRIDGSFDVQEDWPGENSFLIRESMRADPGSVIAGRPGSYNQIVYRDIAKPPLLSGTIDPAPEVGANPGYSGCPLCSNSEIDDGESCDDGNFFNGDGCDETCQIEP